MSRKNRKTIVGEVISTSMDKTAVVKVNTMQKHPRFKKFVRRDKKYSVHDEENQLGVGDRIKIVETRPLSRTKRWRLLEIVERAK